MKLAEYMESQKPALTLRKMADAIGTNYSQVRHWKTGARKPSLEWAERIRVATGGKVKPKDFIS
jgi:DNA-binding transcriptional regulator YdaS (Cro superfamily)